MSDPIALTSTRDALHCVAVHVVARSRQQATGRFSLRVAPGGFGTPDFGPDERRVRVSVGRLLVESDARGAAGATGRDLHGATLRELAGLAAVDLEAPLDVGEDTPALGDIDVALVVDGAAADHLARWYAFVGRTLDRIVVELTAGTSPAAVTLPRLWPEHFDLAIEVDLGGGRRVNLGGSPGDAFDPEPYLYVGPWSTERPGDAAFWNAPFGAMRTGSSIGWPGDESGAEEQAVAFLLEGVRRSRRPDRVDRSVV
jgi:hypothetical protein